MSETLYNHYRVQLADVRQGTQGGKAILASGGTALVVNTGTSVLATLYSKSGGVYSSLAQPLTFSVGGYLDFYVAQPATGDPEVDIYGVAPGGQAFALYELESNTLPELCIDAGERHQTLLVPFSYANMVAPQTEYKSGLQLPVGAVVSPFVAVNIVVAETTGTKTMTAGILSTESGGSASGFVNGVVTSSIGVVPVQSTSTTTRGSLIGGSTLDKGFPVVAASQDISYTLQSTNVTASGFIMIPYDLPFPPTDVGQPSIDTLA